MKTFETKNDIKKRIIRDAVKTWSQKSRTDIDLNSFDPIIDLLLSACSSELEKLAHDIANSRNRIFERLVEILTPDRMTTAQPAYAISYAQPTEPVYITNPHDQLFHKDPELKREIYFSPLKSSKLQQIDIQLMAFDNRIVSLNPQLGTDLLLESSYGHYIPGGEFYLGLRMHPGVQSLSGTSFFFDWKNEVQKNHFLKSISLSQWTINDIPIQTKKGFHYHENKTEDKDINIFAKIGVDKYMEQTISRLVDPHFVTITSDDQYLYSERSKYPAEFGEFFLDEELLRLEENLLWIKISVPTTLQEHLKNMDCQVNCFPVINRKLISKQERLNENVHIIPVDAEDSHFLGIEDLSSSDGTRYREMPLKIVDNSDQGIYALRNRGVKRFDNREAIHMLNYVMDLINEESAAYNGLEYGNLSSDISELETVFKRLKKNVTHSYSQIENTSFIFIRPFEGDNNIFLKYWTTDGDLANRIPHGTILKLASNINLQPATVRLLTTSSGGRNQLQAVDSINAFKEALLSRGKLVTSEDFKNFCVNNLGFRNINSIEVSRGVKVDEDRNRGIVRTIDVIVERKPNATLSTKEWNILCNETEIKLTHLASSVHPIRIISKIPERTYA